MRGDETAGADAGEQTAGAGRHEAPPTPSPGFAPVDPRATALPAVAPAPAAPTPPPLPPGTWLSPIDPSWAPPAVAAPGWAAPPPAAGGWYAWAPHQAPPPPRTGRVVAGVLVGVLVAGVAVVGAGTVVGPTLGFTEDVSAAQAELDAELPELVQFVATSTGRTWMEDVEVELLPEDEFLRALDASTTSSDLPPFDDKDEVGSTYEAMHLVSDAETFYDSWDSRRRRFPADSDSDVVGFYDDRTGRIAVRGPVWDEFTEYTVVHELAHALQDQTFDLSGVDTGDRSDDESSTVTTAVIEGDAELTAYDYYDAQLPSWQYDLDHTSGGGVSSDPDEVVATTLAYFPYQVGPEFVRAVREAGGKAAVDRLFTARPKATRDVVTPDAWIAGRAPEVAQPAFPSPSPGTAGDIVDYGALGVLGLWVTAADATPDLDTADALAGWRGDAYITTEIGGELCMVDDADFVDAVAREKAKRYLRPWVGRAGATMTDRGAAGIRLRSCRT